MVQNGGHTVPTWSPHGTTMEPKSAKGRPKGSAEHQVATNTSTVLKLKHFWSPMADVERTWGGSGRHFWKTLIFKGPPKSLLLKQNQLKNIENLY